MASIRQACGCLRGHHLPVRRPGAPLYDANILLVGDAAGLLNPFTGEGIYAAVWSGQAAAGHLAGYLRLTSAATSARSSANCCRS